MQRTLSSVFVGLLLVAGVLAGLVLLRGGLGEGGLGGASRRTLDPGAGRGESPAGEGRVEGPGEAGGGDHAGRVGLAPEFREPGRSAVVELRSAVSLPLRARRLRESGAPAWQVLDPGAVSIWTLQASKRSREVHAAGHEVLEVPAGGGAYELLPAASLTFVAAAPARDLVVLDWQVDEALDTSCVAAVVDGDFVLASSAESGSDSGSGGPRIVLQLGSGFEVQATWNVQPGVHLRQELDPALAGSLPHAPLEARLELAGGEDPEADRWVWTLHPESLAPSTEVLRIPVEWGSMLVRRALGRAGHGDLAASGARPVFEHVFLGRTYSLTVHDSTWSRVGRETFLFEGSPVVVAPLAGRRFELQLVEGAQGAPLARVPVRIDLRHGEDHSPLGHGAYAGHTRQVSDDEGRIRFSALTALPGHEAASWPPPAACRARIAVPGHRRREVDLVFTAAPGGSCDAGQVVLEREAPDLLLRARSLPAEPPSTLVLGERGEHREFDVEAWSTRDGDGQVLWGLVLDPGEDQAELAPRLQRAIAGDQGIVLRTIGGGLHWFLWRDGEWIEEPFETWSMELHLAEGDHRAVRVGLNWRGTDVPLGRVRPARGSTWSFAAPADAGLWSEERDPSSGLLARQVLPLRQGQVLELR